MKLIDEDQRNRYFTELAIALKREDQETMPPEDGLLTVLPDGLPAVLFGAWCCNRDPQIS